MNSPVSIEVEIMVIKPTLVLDIVVVLDVVVVGSAVILKVQMLVTESCCDRYCQIGTRGIVNSL